MNRIIIFFLNFFFLFNTYQSYSQITISGVVKSEREQKGIFASVVLKNGEGKILSFYNTKEDGKFKLITKEHGDFYLNFSSLAYLSVSKKVTLAENTQELDFEIFLSDKETELDEVIIQNDAPIRFKSDTTVYNASAFLQGNEEVVEDLLKKLPGVDVLSDGSIRIGNQEVEKVMIDGDDFFEKGYKILTKNMPVYPIDKIEVYQNYSNKRHLKGIENSDKVAMNLTLKEDSKRVWFGNVLGGYAPKNHHQIRANLMNFGKETKYYFLSNLNNIGLDGTEGIEYLIRPYRFDEPGSIGDDQTAGKLVSIGSDLPNLKKKRVNLNNAKMLSMNSIFTLSNKTKLKTLAFLNGDRIHSYRNNVRGYSIGNMIFENTEDFSGRNTEFSGFVKADLTYDISNNKTLGYSGKFNKTSENNQGILNFNDENLTESLRNNNQLFDQKLTVINRFKDKSVFLLTGRYILEKIPQRYSVNHFRFAELFSVNADSTFQTSENKMQFLGLEAHLMDRKKNGNLLEIKMGNQLRIDGFNNGLRLFDSNSLINEPNDFYNSLTYLSNDLYFSFSNVFALKKLNFQTQADVHQLFNRLQIPNIQKSQNPFFIVPRLGVDWKINGDNRVRTSYTFNTTNAGVLDIYEGFVQTDFRTFLKGTGEFSQLNSSGVILNYSYGTLGSDFMVNTLFLYSKNHDFFSTNSVVKQNYSLIEQILIKDREYLNFSSNIDRYFKALKSNFKILISGNKSNYKNIVNDLDSRYIESLGLDYGFEIRSGFISMFNYNIGTKWNYNHIKTTFSKSFTDNMSFIDLSFIFNDRFSSQIQTERYFFGNLESAYNTYYFMDLEAKYIVKPNKLTLSLSGNNLFDTKIFKNYSISDISVSKTEYKLQSRYLMLRAEVRF